MQDRYVGDAGDAEPATLEALAELEALLAERDYGPGH
jgi:hypothetical protein